MPSMSDVHVDLAEDSEIETARAVLAAGYAQYEDWFPPANWVPYLADIVDLEGRAQESELLVAKIDGRVVGCVSHFPPGPKSSYPSDGVSERWPAEWAVFRLLAVDPSARGAGVGRRLTEACIERARGQRAPAVGLHTTAAMTFARAMYERMGFERDPRYDFRPGPTVLVEAYRLLL
jgi:GNAT superfamily N-acetyltransferase